MTETMINDKGHLVPVSLVKPQDKLENDLVLELFDNAQALQKQMIEFKQNAFSDMECFVQLLSEQYGLTKGGRKGNMTFMSYDGLTKIQLQVHDTIAFGPELQIAKNLIDECIKDSSDGVNDTILALVNHAFRVDKAGQVNRGSILGLRRLEINNAKWKQAMQAIADSMRTVSTKQYVRFYRRASAEGMWESLTLDFAGV